MYDYETPLKVLQQDFAELAQWSQPLCRYNKLEDFVILDYKNQTLKIKFYTKDNTYHVSAILPGIRVKESFRTKDGMYKKDEGYLGCIVNSRKPRAGEDWSRGNDLSDGSYIEETWNKIKNAIIAYELVKVVKQKNRGTYIDSENILQPSNDSSIEKNSINK